MLQVGLEAKGATKGGMSEVVAQGENYVIERRRNRILCEVWSRPDLTSAVGAELARQKVSWFERLARGDDVGMIFDLARAPPVTGPRTQEALGRMLGAWETACKPLVVVVGSSEMQRLQLSRVQKASAPKYGRVVLDRSSAVVWLDERSGDSPDGQLPPSGSARS